MAPRIAVAAAALGAGFAGQVYAQLRKLLPPGQAMVECAIPERTDREHVRSRLLRLLEGDPCPVALLGLCLRPDPDTIAELRGRGIPVVLVDEEAEGASTVSTDNFAGGYLAGQHLARSGRSAPAVVAGELYANGGYNALQRAQGFAKACAEHELPFSLDEVLQVQEYSRRDGVSAMTRLLDGRRTVDAIFSAAGDATAGGILAVARERGIHVPGELAVIGYDDSPMAAIASPPLTTIKQSSLELAAAALQLATGETAEILARPKRVLLEPRLVVRESA